MSNIQFKQSIFDFPLTVYLDRKMPSWSLARWKENRGLRFVPPDDEGFAIRGDKQRLVYKGRRRSHRFTILGDGAFEYDCILNREPESNIISLRMEGEENFDFLRQPDFVPDPFLKGSYAVYKKETLLGEGTGKLCHIHRPLIIDARGHRCWGVLSVVGNELRITIPEQWLSEAVYPVVVDPTIGTTTVGSQYIYYDIDNEDDYELMYELSVPVNKFLVPENLDGLCTAYFYVNSDDYEAGGRGVIYSDSGNKPLTRRSKEESFIDMRVNSGKPKGWRSGTFKTNTSIASGSYIWFGCFCEYYWMPRFDWGVKCYRGWWANDYDGIPNTYNYSDDWYYEFKLSMYFTYTSAQNYVRTLTQGVTLSDSRNSALGYMRTTAQTVKGTTALNTISSFVRRCLMDTGITDALQQWRVFIRGLHDVVESLAETSRKAEFNRHKTEMVQASGSVFRGLLIFVRILTSSLVRDFVLRRFLIAREELVLKSCITRDITLESQIN